jgi:ribonuclease D
MDIKTHKDDLPPGINLGNEIAVDTEAMGLEPKRDPLTLCQISTGNNDCHIVQFDRKNYKAKNLIKILEDPSILKIFHYARFDVAALKHFLKADIKNIYCTKIASKIARTYTDKHGLKDLVKEIIGVDMSKQMQSSDWGAEKLSDKQLKYAASDCVYLHQIKNELNKMLVRENRMKLFNKCLEFVNTRVELDLADYKNDVFSH